MLFTYSTIVHQENNSYWVEFPDLEECQTFADTLNEAIVNSQEALSAYLLTILEEGGNLCPPSDVLQINDIKNSKSVKKTLTIPSWLNDRALELNINFSKILQESLLEKIQK